MKKPVEPKCPELGCGVLVNRPRCVFELGPAGCPRLPLLQKYQVQMRKYEAHRKGGDDGT